MDKKKIEEIDALLQNLLHREMGGSEKKTISQAGLRRSRQRDSTPKRGT